MKTTVMSFTQDERETNIQYDFMTDTYSIETNVQRHINLVLNKYASYNPIITTINEQGNPTSVIVRGLPNVITFRSLDAIKKGKPTRGWLDNKWFYNSRCFNKNV